ncbi:hypothetical protein [Methylocella sp.]|uniref:hypothetical protein n=1 Tax=Methylocella sp. TaxID=1978226 RepID=UPI0037841492
MKDDQKTPLLEATKVGRREWLSISPGFAYYAAPIDRRRTRRQRTRLRSAKLLDGANGFLADCQIFDRSEGGARVRLFAALAPTASLRLYEDRPEGLFEARLVWRSDGALGLALTRPATGRGVAFLDLLALRNRRYAVTD